MNRSCCIVCLLSVTLIPHLLMGRHPLVCHAYWNKILLSSKKSKRKGKKCYPCHYYSRGQYATIFTTMNFVRTKNFFTLKLHVERIIWSNGIVSSGIVPVLWSDLYFFLYLQSPVKVFSFLFFFFFSRMVPLGEPIVFAIMHALGLIADNACPNYLIHGPTLNLCSC